MRRAGVILAAHGSRKEPAVNDYVQVCARRLAALDFCDEVVAAFHQGSPALSEVLDKMTADRVVLVPVMTSDGYFNNVRLPQELAENMRFPGVSIRQTPPLGTHPRIISIMEQRVRALLRRQDWSAATTSLAIVGHGTRRHPRSRSATLKVVRALRERALCDDVLSAFLDEEPAVETILARAVHTNVVVVPFLIGAGHHAGIDIPQRLGWSPPLHPSSPSVFPVCRMGIGSMVLCDKAIGTHPEVVPLLVEMARAEIEFWRQRPKSHYRVSLVEYGTSSVAPRRSVDSTAHYTNTETALTGKGKR